MSKTQDILEEIHARLCPECDRIEEMPNGLAFLLSLRPESPRRKVFGTVTLDTYVPASNVSVQLLSVEFIVFRNLSSPLPEETCTRLHELSGMALFGTLRVNQRGQLCYRYTCMVNDYSPSQTAELFAFICYEMLLFLHIHYDYLLLCTTTPERLTTEEYLQYLASAAEPEQQEETEREEEAHA